MVGTFLGRDEVFVEASMIQHDAHILLKLGKLRPEHPGDKRAKAKPTGEKLHRYLI